MVGFALRVIIDGLQVKKAVTNERKKFFIAAGSVCLLNYVIYTISLFYTCGAAKLLLVIGYYYSSAAIPV